MPKPDDDPLDVLDFNDDDLHGIGCRIAEGARLRLEAQPNSPWAYLPSFREAVVDEAVLWLKTTVQHERRQRRLKRTDDGRTD